MRQRERAAREAKKNHFFNGRQRERGGAVFQGASAELSTGEHLQHIRQGVRKHAGFLRLHGSEAGGGGR